MGACTLRQGLQETAQHSTPLRLWYTDGVWGGAEDGLFFLSFFFSPTWAGVIHNSRFSSFSNHCDGSTSFPPPWPMDGGISENVPGVQRKGRETCS